MPIPRSVTWDELQEALQPLYELLGTNPYNFFAEPGITLSGTRYNDSRITFMVPVSHEETPDGRAKSEKAYKRANRSTAPHPQGLTEVRAVVAGDGESDESAEWAYEITVEVTA